MKSILVAAAALSAIAAPAFAQNDSMTVNGSIPAVCSIQAPGDATVNLASGSSQAIGGVTIQCNDPQGFTAGASSANGGKLVNTEAAGSSYAYTLTVEGMPGNFPLTQATQSIDAGGLGGAAWAINPQVVNLGVAIGAQNGPAFSGTYSDVITFSISAN
ncbi:hypothetical protein ACIQC9_00520 [Brevundimonas sp. NPDC092305]|uniref:hypothetical protein n=1 Tax=Brevundimonas sp. NPDC092305 TaxID=3363957 RepID=UPI0037F2117D